MERSDFSVPRRMSKSAFIILLVKELLSYAGPFLIWAIIKLFNSGKTSYGVGQISSMDADELREIKERLIPFMVS